MTEIWKTSSADHATPRRHRPHETSGAPEAEVAARLFRCLAEGPRGRLVDFGGPEVLTLGQMAAAWMEVNGIRKKLLHLPLPGAAAKALRGGKNTAPDGVRGVIRWRVWLERRLGSQTIPVSGPAHAVRS